MDNKEPKRFTSKAEITPVNPFEENNANQTPQEPATNNKSTPSTVRHIPITTEPPFGSAQRVASPSRMSQFSNSRATPTQEYYQSPRSGRKVHYIPIYVEGSEKPVLPKNMEEPAEQKSFASAESVPSKRPSEACSFGSSVPTPHSAASSKSNQSTPFSHHEREVPIQVETPVSAASSRQTPPPPQPPPAPVKPDPLKQVQDVQQEVDELTRRVEQFSGASRADKDYLYLDEMLTRNLIKLDIIEVAGNEELRVARKNVIRCIQQAIALLESKVPVKKSDESGAAETIAPMDQDGASVEVKNDEAAESENQTPNAPPPNGTPAQPTDTNEGGKREENSETADKNQNLFHLEKRISNDI
ncbi:hypothetical protein V9T40_005323 [Parthenolecanium corni]|uniref:BAG domain-containing protein n=1 Tax=Parthenolecanium corni TaxID=536013 RepID=A0AAN9TIJ5_9HEMI